MSHNPPKALLPKGYRIGETGHIEKYCARCTKTAGTLPPDKDDGWWLIKDYSQKYKTPPNIPQTLDNTQRYCKACMAQYQK